MDSSHSINNLCCASPTCRPTAHARYRIAHVVQLDYSSYTWRVCDHGSARGGFAVLLLALLIEGADEQSKADAVCAPCVPHRTASDACSACSACF